MPTGPAASTASGGFNASVLVVEVPIALIQGRANRAGTYLANDTTIGVWGTTGRGKMRKHPGRDDDDNDGGRFTQVQRMGHQLFKTVFLPTAVKDAFNASTPTDDARRVAQFIPDALTSNDPNGNTIAARAALLTALGFTTLPDGAPLLLGDTFTNTDKELLRHVLIPDVLRFNLAAPAKGRRRGEQRTAERPAVRRRRRRHPAAAGAGAGRREVPGRLRPARQQSTGYPARAGLRLS